MEPTESVLPKKNINKIYLIVGLISIFIVSYFIFSAPLFSTATTIHVVNKESLKTISAELKNKNIIRSTTVFEFLVKFSRGSKSMQIGDYFFENNFSVWKVAWMVARGYHNVNPIRITLREGITNDEMGNILSNNLPNFNKKKFDEETTGKQGELFPDTYFIFPLSTTDEVVETLETNFRNHIKSLNKEITNSKHSLSEVVTMASIIEKESSGEKDAQVISGILWKRINLKMPLQVDASPVTYKVAGLPSEPISNPGMVAINASIHPTASPYVYYLHDKSGMIHLASTFAEHKSNIAKYLR